MQPHLTDEETGLERLGPFVQSPSDYVSGRIRIYINDTKVHAHNHLPILPPPHKIKLWSMVNGVYYGHKDAHIT